MIIAYEDFKHWLNAKLFEDSYKDLISKIAENPDRFIGLFRPTKPKTKLIQNITQSHEIRFGDALEFIFEQYFRTEGFIILTKRITYNDAELNIDQLFVKDDNLYMIEQKVRDDHDSTKKRGQFKNFEEKYYALTVNYPQYNVIPIMWFIDDSLKKNKNYYFAEMNRMKIDYQCNPCLYYGEEMFNTSSNGISSFRIEMWNEILNYLETWKETLPDMPEVNFDLEVDKVFDEIKSISPAIFRKLLSNEDVVNQIFPILFPQNLILEKLKEYFIEKHQPIYRTLASYIQTIIENKPNSYVCYEDISQVEGVSLVAEHIVSYNEEKV